MHKKNAEFQCGTVLENAQIARETYRLRITAEKIAPLVRPGQFVMLRLPYRSDPLLGRPLAVYRVGEKTLEVVYLVVGKMTTRLVEIKPGDPLELWGPLGNGFPKSTEESQNGRLIMVAGGIGQTPFLMFAESFLRTHGPGSAVLLYGVRSSNRICCVDDFRNIGTQIEIATDDGSLGYHGPVTDLIPQFAQKTDRLRIVCCGPHPMLKSAFFKCRQLQLPCEVSLESPMSCGLGICFGCAVEIKTSDAHNLDNGLQSDYNMVKPDKPSSEYVRCCTEGPVFDAYQLVWE